MKRSSKLWRLIYTLRDELSNEMGCWHSKAPRMSTAHLQDTAVSFSVVESLPVLGTGLFIVYCFVCHKLYKAKKNLII